MEEEIWEHLVGYLELLAASHMVVLLIFFKTTGCCSHCNWIGIFLCIKSMHFWFCKFPFRPLDKSTISSLFIFSLLVIQFSWFLSPPSSRHLLFTAVFYLISVFLHYSISLFLTTPTLANPVCRLSETFLGIVNRCLQHCADMSWSTVLQLWKKLRPQPSKTKQQSTSLGQSALYCLSPQRFLILSWIRIN